MSNLSHHQRQLLQLMGVQVWVEVATPCVKMPYSTVWRDGDVNDDMTDGLSSSIAIDINHQPLDTNHVDHITQQTIIDEVDEYQSVISSQQINITKQILENSSNHRDLIDEHTVQVGHHHAIIQHKFEQNIFVASCISEQIVLMTQFDVDIQAPHHAEREDVRLWRNIRNFFNQIQMRLTQKEIQHQVLVWGYDFIDIEPNMMGYFQQGYIEVITQQKKVLLLGDWQGNEVAEHWQQLPSLAQMLQHADAKRKVYRTMMTVMQ